MADDIDIEEHDVMDNPAIKSMFPDLSVIKKELNFYDEDLNINKEEITRNSDIQEIIVSELQNPDSTTDLILNNTQHLTEDRIPVSSTQIDSYCESNELIYEKVTNGNDSTVKMPFCCNKIILGSKPTKKLTEDEDYFEAFVKPYQSKILLEDLGPYLDRSERYCKDCSILFPESHAFNVHRETIHIDLNVNKLIMNKYTKFEVTDKNKKFLCMVCNMSYCTSASLNRHFKNVHTNRMQTRREFRQLQNEDDNAERTTNNSGNPCFHCSKSFPTQQSLIEHLYNILESKQFVCDQCPEKFPNKEKLDEHVKLHKINAFTKQFKEKNVTDNSHFKTGQQMIMRREKEIPDSQNKSKHSFYRCFVCSYYLKSFQYYSTHLIVKHKYTKTPERKIALFDPKCKYCSSVCTSATSYNTHLQKYHKLHLSKIFKINDKNKIIKSKRNLKKPQQECKQNSNLKNIQSKAESSNIFPSNINSLILKSTLFKCTKCDIHFLSSKSARDHCGHMELLINWKCSICQFIFKKNDEQLHKAQHSYSNTFNLFNVSESSISTFLYKCPKCAIHFQEDKFFAHYSTCNLENSKSFYCKVCNILIDSNLKKCHIHMLENGIVTRNYTVIDSDVIIHKVSYKQEKVINRNKIEYKNKNIARFIKKQKLAYTYCGTCKCFITRFRNEVHIEGRCTHLIKCICTYCGLMLTRKSIMTHKKLHQVRKTLKLQDFNFYKLIGGEQISPPMPEFPSCKICGIHFVYKMTVRKHVCHKTKYLTCYICQMKFSGEAFQLHMNFHCYSLNYVKEYTAKRTKDNFASPNTKKSTMRQKTPNMLNVIHEAELLKTSECHPFNIIYLCKKCNVVVNTYDEVIEHCQDHYSNKEIQIYSKLCEICNLKFHHECYEYHQRFHSLRNETKSFFSVLNFDIFYFTSDHNTWIKHLFACLSKELTNKIISQSIYRFECRIKMKVVQDGASNLTVYKCDKCCTFIDPSSLHKHTINTCFRVKKHPCTICGLPFNSFMYRKYHEKIHDRPNITLKSYRIVIFNQEQDKQLNNTFSSHNQYILYQCRNCDGIVNKFQLKSHECNIINLKNCTECGLLIYSSEYDLHISQHKDFNSFVRDNIRIILFGKKLEEGNTMNKKLVSTFSGIVYDYTFYKCMKCQVCERNEQDKLKHDCSYGSLRVKCSKCDLYFFIGKLKNHQTLHNNDPDFSKDTIQIIIFNEFGSNKIEIETKVLSKRQRNFKENYKNALENSSSCNNNNECVKLNTDGQIKEKMAKLYKCTCGLHFINESSIRTHFSSCGSNVKASKQTCSKCNLLFAPNILFCHLLTHHGNKDYVYKFEIVEMSNKNCIASNPKSTSLLSNNEISKHGDDLIENEILNVSEDSVKALNTKLDAIES